jgi:prepilin-type N-terminal cleavage/methylation domain-containing protein
MQTRGDRDAGVSLPELIITMALIGVFTTIVLALVTTMTRNFTHESAATDSTMTAAKGMNELTRVIRAGTTLRTAGATKDSPVFVTAGSNTVEMYAYIDADPKAPRPIKVRFDIDAQGRVRETRWLATNAATPWSFSATPLSTRTIAHAVPAGSPPVFTYLDSNNKPLPIPSTGSLSETDRASVAAVQILLTVQSRASSKAGPVELRNTVSIPNLGVSRIQP